MKPLIGILSNLSTIESGSSIGWEKVFINKSYVDAIENSGGIPIVIPVNTNKENIKRQIECVDGIIISGGIDVNPTLYNEEPIPGLGEVHPETDEFDIEAINIALDMKKPIFGICRGLQVINVALGGTLYQDLNCSECSKIKHVQNTKPYLGTHYIEVKEKSLISEVLGNKILVNTYHHQSIKRLGKDLEVIAYSNDGIIEAIQGKGDSFILGVQWHPELMIKKDERMLNLFKRFISEC